MLTTLLQSFWKASTMKASESKLNDSTAHNGPETPLSAGGPRNSHTPSNPCTAPPVSEHPTRIIPFIHGILRPPQVVYTRKSKVFDRSGPIHCTCGRLARFGIVTLTLPPLLPRFSGRCGPSSLLAASPTTSSPRRKTSGFAVRRLIRPKTHSQLTLPLFPPHLFRIFLPI
jgi:hypothetical protein